MSLMTVVVARYPILRFATALVVSLIGAVLVMLLMLNITTDEVSELTIYMSGTGLITLFLSYIFYRLGIAQRFSSLRLTLTMTIILTVVLIFINVWVTAKLIFVDVHYVTLTTALLVFAGLCAVTFGYFISKTMIDRISRLSLAVDKLAHGDLTTRLKVEGNDELAGLASNFNSMASNLEQLDEQKRNLERTRRDLVAWVSHDLRTPLATMRVMIEAISDGVVSDPETISRYLLSSRAEIEHLNRLINDLFELAQFDVGHLNLVFHQASLRDLISDTLGSMTLKAEQRQISLKAEVATNVDTVQMAPDKIQRVLYNLLDNAVKYTPLGGSILLKAYRAADFIQVDIQNSGVYIDPEAQQNIFKSFYRGETSRAKSGDGERGTGLGLAIARAFVEAHQGKIWVESDPTRGTSFSFVLPVTWHEG